MEHLLIQNAIKAKWVIGGFAAASLILSTNNLGYLKKHEVFGYDGNGGHMLKIITILTDEEMARLKYVRRVYWHWKGSRKYDAGRNMISDQELSDLGIKQEAEPYIEYSKRPPHDKYL